MKLKGNHRKKDKKEKKKQEKSWLMREMRQALDEKIKRIKSVRKWSAKRKLAGIAVFAALCAAAVPVSAALKSYVYSADPSGSVRWVQLDDKTWTMDLDSDGNTDVTLTASKDSSGNDVWKYVFNVEDNSAAYYVYEAMLSSGSKQSTSWLTGYTSEGSDSKSGVEADPGTIDTDEHSYTITNHKDHTAKTLDYGSLSLEKKVTGTMPNEDTKFTFRITLSGSTSELKSDISGAKVFGETPFADGQAMVSLGKDEKITITDLPAGLTYEIEEVSKDGYTQSSVSGESGTITKDAESSAVFTNDSSYTPPAGNGTFTLKKKVTGSDADANAEYTFHVALDSLAAEKTYSYAKGSDAAEYTADSSGSASLTLKLKADDEYTFTLPEGAHYQILEEAGAYTSSYSIAGSGGSIVSAGKSNANENTELATEKETADQDENVTVTFTNKYRALQSLTVMKYIEKNGTRSTSDASFSFTLKLSGLSQEDAVTSPVGKMTADEDGEAEKTFTIKASGENGKITFGGIPAGASYQITEEKNGYKPTYSIAVADSRGKTVTGTVVRSEAEGASGQALSTAEETLEEGQSDTVTFVNEPGFNFGIIKISENDQKTVIPSAVYQLYRYENGTQTLLGTKTTDSSGFAGWDSMSSGLYILKETQSPAGYKKGPDIIFAIQDDETVKYGTTYDSDADITTITDSVISRMATWKPYGASGKHEDSITGLTYSVYPVYENVEMHIPTGVDFSSLLALAAAAGICAFLVWIIIKKKERKGETQ